VLAAGRRLRADGFRVLLFRARGRAMPRSVDGPWDWPALARTARLRPRGAAAITIAPAWGVSAAPSRPEPFGRGGPWEAEAAAIERAYGADRTIHVSLEEFGRTLTSRAETRERLREGGVRARQLARGVAVSRRAGDVRQYREAFRRFRAFERPNVLHVFATFGPAPAFAREFPEAVLTGPLWPEATRRRRTARRAGEWVWYASPSSAETIASQVARGLAGHQPPVRLYVRGPRPWTVALPKFVRVATRPVPAATWRRRFAEADLRIVTGSRTLLEAMELGGPFLYFNGVLGRGRARRRHRPEKIAGLLVLARSQHAPPDLVRDLADFAAGRRVAEVVRRAADRAGGWARFPRFRVRSFAPPFDDAGSLVTAVARALDRAPDRASGIVARVRARSHP
jgi:hypothetical protein